MLLLQVHPRSSNELIILVLLWLMIGQQKVIRQLLSNP